MKLKASAILVIFSFFLIFNISLCFGDKYIQPDMDAMEKLGDDAKKCVTKYLKKVKDCKKEYKDKEKTIEDIKESNNILKTCNDDALKVLYKCKALKDKFKKGKSLATLKKALLKADKKRDKKIDKCFKKNEPENEKEVKKDAKKISSCLKKVEQKYVRKIEKILEDHFEAKDKEAE